MSTSVLLDLTPLLAAFAALFGVVVGSFLNVVIHRVPDGLSVVSPRSACPGCSTQIRGIDNIPLISWLLLRGRCRSCRAPISIRYPLVEATTGILFAIVAAWSLTHSPSLSVVLLYLSAAGVALFMIDLDCKRLPDQIVLPSYPVVIAGLALVALTDGIDLVAVLGSALVWFFMFAVPWFVTAGRGMGFGDVKLAPLLGAALGAVGWGASLVGLMSGFLVGAVVGVALIALGDAGRKTKVPYGPFMLGGALLGLLAGESLFGSYLRLMGL